MKRVKIEKLELYSGSDSQPETIVFENVQDALLGLIYLKTGLIFLKPEKGIHVLVPDNLREYQNMMLMLKKLDSVVDVNASIIADKTVLRKNLEMFKHYFLDTWIKQNLTKDHQEDLIQFIEEPVESKNKLIYFKLMSYVENIQENMPNNLKGTLKSNLEIKDNYSITAMTPSYNVSLANVFEAINQIDVQKDFQNIVSAIAIIYSIICFEMLYIESKNEDYKICDLFHGRIFEFTYVEKRTYGLLAKIDLDLGELSIEIEGSRQTIKKLNEDVKKIISEWKELEPYMVKEQVKGETELTEDQKKDEMNKYQDKYNESATNLAKVIGLLFTYLFIYNGYHSTTMDDGTTLGKRFYERAVYFKQKKYTLAPSGFFYKILNLERLIELVLRENIDGELEIDEQGCVISSGDDEAKLPTENSIGIMKKNVIDQARLEFYSDGLKDGDTKSIITAWKLLIENDRKTILPFSSFEYMKKMSDVLVDKSVSKYRKDGRTAINRFVNSNSVDNKGYFSELKEEDERLSKNNTISYFFEKEPKQNKILNRICSKTSEIQLSFDLMKMYQFNLTSDNIGKFKTFKEAITFLKAEIEKVGASMTWVKLEQALNYILSKNEEELQENEINEIIMFKSIVIKKNKKEYKEYDKLILTNFLDKKIKAIAENEKQSDSKP